MVWLNFSPIPVGRRGVIPSFKLFLPVLATLRGGGEGVGALWSLPVRAQVGCSQLVQEAVSGRLGVGGARLPRPHQPPGYPGQDLSHQLSNFLKSLSFKQLREERWRQFEN
jgi:hypothetical protein